MIDYPFTEQEAVDAYAEWGCNCGPAALAFACQLPLSAVRGAIPGFEAKRYTSPTMMEAALRNLGRPFEKCDIAGWLFAPRPALVRIQWEGPWTAPGANPRWAYRHTHWIVTWSVTTPVLPIALMVFDINGGILRRNDWEDRIVPAIVKTIPRASGEWDVTHLWRLTG